LRVRSALRHRSFIDHASPGTLDAPTKDEARRAQGSRRRGFCLARILDSARALGDPRQHRVRQHHRREPRKTISDPPA
jgi:hypothetical protein